jgi:hypothetical protein
MATGPTIPQGVPAAEQAILVGPVALELTPVAKGKHRITARRVDGGDIVAVDTVDLGRAAQRTRFIEQILEKMALAEHDDAALNHALDQRLLEISAAPTAVLQVAGDVVAPEAEFSVVDDPQNPRASGLYWNLEVPPAQICNFAMRITEHVVLRDEGQQETRLRLVIRHRGLERAFEMTAAEFTSNGQLRTAVYGAALPGVDIKLGADVLRRAVIAVSDPAIRQVTTATGWTDDRSKFLVPGGHADAHGYREYDPAQGVAQVDLAGYGTAQWLGFLRLSQEQLQEVKQHLVNDVLRLHERSVMRSLFGTVALAPLRSLAAPRSRPAIWLRGLTGSGKTFLSSLFMNFFGDYPLSASGRIATWGSTANYLQMIGFYHRDCPVLIDDYKPETTDHDEVLRLLQNSGDGTARGRLRHDATTRTTRPVRGIILATAEDFPIQNASGLARSIIVEVPNRAKDAELGDRCLKMSPLYRGVMAEFLAWVIHEEKGAAFADRVEHWQRHYYRSIRGRQNDARIAGNHALLAAAFEVFAAYMQDVWPGAAEEAEEFALNDLAEMVSVSVGSAESEQASTIFLESLRSLLDWGQVRFEGQSGSKGHGASDGRSKATVVGRVVAGCSADDGEEGRVVELSLAMALQAVQRSLRQQGRPAIRISEKTLIAQLEAEGLVLDRANRPIAPGQSGGKSRQVRIDGSRVRVIRMNLDDLLGSDGEALRGEPPRRRWRPRDRSARRAPSGFPTAIARDRAARLAVAESVSIRCMRS